MIYIYYYPSLAYKKITRIANSNISNMLTSINTQKNTLIEPAPHVSEMHTGGIYVTIQLGTANDEILQTPACVIRRIFG